MSRTIAGEPDTVYAASEGDKFNAETTLAVVECPTCGITYAIPDSLKRSALKWRGDRIDGCGWKLCCPLGHQWWYTGYNETQRLRNQLSAARSDAGRLAAARDQARAEARAQKAAKTRFKNERDRDRRRVAHGVCPCCGRTFKQLARHMASQHPGFADGIDK